mmetsp:Transcript_13731/g.26307  ORF Transcript_13731/g.26307 Transcript_13731/m.26307 type:complete len:95 (+) Transcript_13731:340-624(+)
MYCIGHGHRQSAISYARYCLQVLKSTPTRFGPKAGDAVMTANLSSVFEGAELRRQDHPQDFSNKTKLQWRWLIVIYTTADAYGADNYGTITVVR